VSAVDLSNRLAVRLAATAPRAFNYRAAKLATSLVGLPTHIRRRWYLYFPVFAIWGLAFARVFVDPTPRLPLLFNWTPSLPYRVAVMAAAPRELLRGNFIVFSFAGDAVNAYPGLAGQPFFKIVRGIPGDRITVEDRVVSINGEVVGFAKTHASDHRPLATIAATVIPPGRYYVQGTSPDSFDSRYRASGLVRSDQVLAKVLPLF
jgi:conjugal transfer pilin signal peptidase TrbI